VDAEAEGQAHEFHLELVEMLKLLNRSEEEHGLTDGLEREELLHLVAKAGFPNATLRGVARALDVLTANGLARMMAEPVYAWDRGRVVGERYGITLDGKRMLLNELHRVGRV
jgi:hypothetical protein